MNIARGDVASERSPETAYPGGLQAEMSRVEKAVLKWFVACVSQFAIEGIDYYPFRNLPNVFKKQKLGPSHFCNANGLDVQEPAGVIQFPHGTQLAEWLTRTTPDVAVNVWNIAWLQFHQVFKGVFPK